MSDHPNARIDWDEDGQPLSRDYGDVYFSRDSGLDETEHVFLAPNRLRERFAELTSGSHFVIGETGFGTGLNFLCAWRLFEQTAPADSRLHFISVEKHPLSRVDLERALSLWPELSCWGERLLQQYHAVLPGFQRFVLAAGRVVLTLLIDDALAALNALDARVDAWFLDGFAPAKNPDMWSPAVFSQLARLSSQDATFGTFTSVGDVRRGLQQVGFHVMRVPGFGHKREMLTGRFHSASSWSAKPWYARPPAPTTREAVVIGGGIAGCATAASLAERGWRVCLIERHERLAQEGSGNPQGVLYLKLSAHKTALSELNISGFGYTRRRLQALDQGGEWQVCGVIQLAFDEAEKKRQCQLENAFPATLLQAKSREEAETIAGVELNEGGLFFPEAGWVRPGALCDQLVDHPNIRVLNGLNVELKQDKGAWMIFSQGVCVMQSQTVILATGKDLSENSHTRDLPLKRIRGQITQIPATSGSESLRTVLCGEGYVTPARNNLHTVGATFDLKSDEAVMTLADQLSNLNRLERLSEDLAQRLKTSALDAETLPGRAAFRSAASDYLPIVGPLAQREAFNDAYAILAKDARQTPDKPCPWLEGLYINGAHGSRGLISAPLAAELLAAWICGEPLPLPRAIAEACHPNRFLHRDLVRGKG